MKFGEDYYDSTGSGDDPLAGNVTYCAGSHVPIALLVFNNNLIVVARSSWISACVRPL